MAHCSLHPNIDTAKGCNACYNSWPFQYKRIKRAVCKRQNWHGQVDINHNNETNNFSESEFSKQVVR